jgi:hypothetical protein
MVNRDNQKKKPTGAPPPPNVNDILGSLKQRTGRETSRWMAGLADENITQELFDNSHHTDNSPVPTHPSAIGLVDHLFDFFQQIEFEFNKTVAGTDCIVTIERPIYCNEKVRVRFQQSDTVRVFRGRVSTRYWSLIVRAHNDVIHGWVIPAEQVFGFRPDDNQSETFFTIESIGQKNGKHYWRVNNAEVCWEETRFLAKQIFTSLIRVARGEARETDPLLLSTNAGASNESPVNPSAGHQAATSAGSLLRTANQATTGAPGSQPVAMQEPQTQLQTPPTKQSLRGQRAVKSLAPPEPTIDSVVDSLSTILSRELLKLSKQGAEAFAMQDMAAVDKIYRKSVRIKELQDQLLYGMQQWKQAVKQVMDS